MKHKLAAWISLCLIAVVAAVCLAATNEITKDVIEEQGIKAAEEARVRLIPEAESFAPLETEEVDALDNAYEGKRWDETVGFIAQTTAKGFGGPVEIIVGVNADGSIAGVSVGGSAFAETAGLGAKAKDPAFAEQFEGDKAPLTLGEDVDAITAATITSNAVIKGVNTALEALENLTGVEMYENEAVSIADLGGGRYGTSKPGFAGPVYVEIQLDAAGAITEIVIGDASFSETPSYGGKAQAPAFSDQFIGKSDSVALGENVDAVSGATITSKAVVDAVNLLFLYHKDPAAALAESAPVEFVMPEIPADALTAYAATQGFGGPVEVTITTDAAGEKLLNIVVGGDNWGETEGFGSKCK